jgi:exodeoxyribonuclease V gamma subunit
MRRTVLRVHRAERADRLADALSEMLLDPLEDPFAPEVISVPTRGMERWLTQRMSTRLGTTEDRADGVCANIEFPFPRRLVGGALATATGLDPEKDPWSPERLVWPLLEVVDECLEEPWLASLAAHLRRGQTDPDEPERRFGAVRRIADLFDRYGVHRPEMLRAWAAGRDDAGSDRRIPDEAAWQAELWRRLRSRIAQPSTAERLPGACALLREEPVLLSLPSRLSLFGLTRLPRSYLEVLAALAARREVHLFLLHPSPALWQDVASTLSGDIQIIRRREDPTARLAANRLLASWGQDARELQLVVAATGETADDHYPGGEPGNTLLSLVQADILSDRQPPGPPLPDEPDMRPVLDPADHSLQVHSCHGRARQVEVLRDAVLHVLEDDPTLEPRDVIVMCPDIETFAPLITATFGAAQVDAEDEQEPMLGQKRRPDLRVRLADRSLRQTNPVLGVVAELLDLAGQRVTASQLLDLADREPVRRRFRFDDDDLTRMQDWVAASGIRWGLDAGHRKPFKLEGVPAGTWRAGLDRLLLGVAMTEDDRRLVGGVLPLDDVDSGAIDVAGRMTEYVDRVRSAVDGLSAAKSIDAWSGAIARAAATLTATSERDSWQSAELRRLLAELVGDASADGSLTTVQLELADIRALLADRLRGRPTRANFRTGHLTICTLVPMRSVPHRVVCVLGLDDGEFPRSASRDGDDLMLEDPHVGDRDPRAEDRQMLLDALLAATDRLILTYTGNDERTNLLRPPAVPVGELLDIVDRTVRTDDVPARARVVVRHPLQPFDPRNFTLGTLVSERFWGFDPVALDGARALTGPRTEPGQFLPGPLPDRRGALVELDNLVRFVEHPVRAFLRQRLGVSVSESFDEVEDALPVELDGLEQWGVGQRLLEGCLSGVAFDACEQAEIARGSLPPGMLGTPLLGRLRPLVEEIAKQARLLGGGDAESLDVRVQLPDGRSLAGTVPGVFGDTVRTVNFARVSSRHRLAAWVRLLALTAARPERPFDAAVIGRARSSARSARVTIARIPSLGADAHERRTVALSCLAVLIDLYDRGMREPLPLACDASGAYAQAAAAGRSAEAAARKEWESARYPKEDRQPEHVLVYGRVVSFDELLDESPRADEQGDGWAGADGTRFGGYARRLWDGPLAREVIVDQ